MKNNKSNLKATRWVGTEIRIHLAAIARNLLILGIIVQLLLAKAATAQQPSPSDWSYTVGVGTAVVPSYLGDDEHQMLLFPNFSATYRDKFSFSLLEGLTYNAWSHGNWKAGAVLKYHIGRYEDGTLPSRVAGDKTGDLIGLGDIDPTIEPGLFLSHTYGPINTRIEMRHGIGGHQGLIGSISSQYSSNLIFLHKSIGFTIGPEIQIAGTEYSNAFFGINEQQSSETGFGTYATDFGTLAYGISGSLVIPAGKRLSTVVFARYSRLGDTIAASDLIKEQGTANQTSIGLLFNYKL